jgi:hypothetical protein
MNGESRVLYKAAGDTADFSVAWLGEVGSAETIASSSWSLPTALTLVDDGTNAEAVVIFGVTYAIGTVAVAYISGGVLGQVYRVTNTIVTTGSPARTFVKELLIKIQA